MIRFGVIGTNWITEEFINAASSIEDFVVTSVYSRTEEKAKEFASKHNVATIFTDLKKFAESTEIDAVYIASPNSLHASQSILMLNHGKHVICEKPIASNKTELQAMTATAKKNNMVLMEALKSSFLPAFRSIQENLHKIGTVRRYFASYCQYSSRYDAYKNGTVLNAFNPGFSNGALMDIGIYCIHPMLLLFGKPLEVKASAFLLESGVDGEGSLLAHYEEMEGIVMYSKITNSYIPSEIQGEEGSILIDKISSPEKVEIRYKDGSLEDITPPLDHHSMYYEAKEFIDLIKNRKVESKINSHQLSLNVMEVLDEARKQIGLVFPADK